MKVMYCLLDSAPPSDSDRYFFFSREGEAPRETVSLPFFLSSLVPIHSVGLIICCRTKLRKSQCARPSTVD